MFRNPRLECQNDLEKSAFGVFGVGLVNAYKLFYGIKDDTYLHNRMSFCHFRDVVFGSLDLGDQCLWKFSLIHTSQKLFKLRLPHISSV